jgi:LPXTG-motif cell wall-anchored protein
MRRQIGGLAALLSAASLVGGAVVLPGTAGAATVRADTPAPSPYSAGEYCSQTQAGEVVVAQNGEIITCVNNNGLRWEPTGGVEFSNAVYSGDAAGTELGLSLSTGSGSLGSYLPSGVPSALGQAVSSAATNSKGLTTAQNSVPGNVINPVEAASVLDYASGLGAGYGNSQGALTPVGGGQATSTAPPQQPAATSSLASQTIPGLGSVGILQSQASTLANSCPITQPVAYGTSNAASAQLLDASTLPSAPGVPAPPAGTTPTGPVISTADTSNGTAVASTVTQTAFTSNGDGTYGADSVAKETIAPVTVNFGAFQLQLTVAGASPSDPVTLDAHAPANGKPATVTLASNDVITLTAIANGTKTTILSIPISQLGPNGIHEDLSTSSPVGSNIQTVLNTLVSQSGQSSLGSLGAAFAPIASALNGLGANSPITGSLGHIDIDATPFAIGGAPGSAPVAATNGTAASGQIDLIKLQLGLSASANGTAIPTGPLADIGTLDIGHLEAVANLNKAFSCPAAVTTAAASAPPAAAASTPAGTPQSLPVTGAEGGLWQPGLGVGLLALGGGLLLLIRRSRRRVGG